MSADTGISWCDSTFNPWMGCTKVSPACDHCYAERDTRRFGRVEWGAGKPRVRTSAANWKLPEQWNRAPWVQCACGWRGGLASLRSISEQEAHCPKCGTEEYDETRRRVFCASLADWLDNEAPIEWLVDLLDLIRRTPNLDWLLLTKRIGNWRARLTSAHGHFIESADRRELSGWIWGWLMGRAPANVWLGSTVINQEEADRDVPKLLAVPARVRFLSIEPMLGPIKLDDDDQASYCLVTQREIAGDCGHGQCRSRGFLETSLLNWIICGGESGPHARPMHPAWVRSLRNQCAAAGVPFHFKQWGEWREDTGDGSIDSVLQAEQRGIHTFEGFGPVFRYGKKAAGRQLDGLEHNGFPAP